MQHIHPLEKNFLADFSEEHPEVLDHYRKIMGVSKEVRDSEFEEDFNPTIFARALINGLNGIPRGDAAAHKYHDFMIGTLEFIFYPDLIYPEKEAFINEGRKRIDILYTNSSNGGFFFRRRAEVNVAANKIVVECKNYMKEIANPELDQVIGRFSVVRGRLGFVVARSLDNRERFIARCKDTVHQGLGYILLFEDKDIIEMLEYIESGNRLSIDRKLEKMFNEIIL